MYLLLVIVLLLQFQLLNAFGYGFHIILEQLQMGLKQLTGPEQCLPGEYARIWTTGSG